MPIVLATEAEHNEGANFLVHGGGWEKPVPCDTENEVWEAIGRLRFGMPYRVSSPVGLSCSEFIPF